MKKGKIIFKGEFWPFALWNILWAVVTTVGAFFIIPALFLIPYIVFWNLQYIAEHTEIEFS
jgi:hypothetical protein